MTSSDGCCGISTLFLISADGATPILPLHLGGEFREEGRGESRREGEEEERREGEEREDESVQE